MANGSGHEEMEGQLLCLGGPDLILQGGTVGTLSSQEGKGLRRMIGRI